MSYSNATINNKLDEVLAEARAIKFAMTHGALTYEEAKEKVKPLLEKVNIVGEEIAKKYGTRHRAIKFTNL